MKLLNILFLYIILCFIIFLNCNQYHLINVDNDYRTLLNANTFSDSGTGYGGHPTKETIAFKHIFNKNNAINYFNLLLLNANYEGKLYALCGLYHYDYNNYKKELLKFYNLKIFVNVFEGCHTGPIYISEMIQNNKINVIRLKNNKQTINEFISNYKYRNGFLYDFYGGGYPKSLIEYITSKDPRIINK